MTPCIKDVLQHHSKQLEVALNLDSGSARIEVQCLLQAVLRVNRAYLLTYPEQLLGNEQQARFNALFERRLSGEPIAYLLGEREFYGLTFKVSPATLIPRPETELLVEQALQRIPHPDPSLRSPQPSDVTTSHSTRPSIDNGQVAGYPAGGRGSKFRVLDLGTGSGAIALSIAHARPNVQVVAVDASDAALEVAQFNAQRLNLRNVRLLHSDWFSALQDERFDIIVSNPPYIAADDAHLTQGDVRFEPSSALASGAHGLDDIRLICTQAKAHLNISGWLIFEHGYDQAEQVRRLLHQAGFAGIFSVRDLSGIERVSGGS
jgi:release factor glutamine methyltransferase